ncbi:MAG: hypothetical protein A3K10_06770 [Bacteroidetes bacterium RIFCSPLOWO2_12_FULL_31_6]|nr:MAG: hypothetical protein A3K10_06770 [Bacteroidetes bacterium RIFCSPLOWO2_12_FULL_31_6]
MKDLKLVQVLSKFSKTEMRKFQDFIDAPFFNKNENICLLNKIITKQHPNFSDPSFSKESVYLEIPVKLTM